MTSVQRHRFTLLDGFRGTASAIVLLFHVLQHLGYNGIPYTSLAVDFFFMLSGFVISFAYEDRLRAGDMSFRGFMRVRLVRLYPLAFLGISAGIALGFLAVVMKGDVSAVDVTKAGILGLLLLPSYVFPQWSTAYPFNMASWSLTFELFTNVVFAAIIFRISLRKLAVCVGVFAIGLVILAVVHHGIDSGYDQDNFFGGFVRVLFPFFAGVMLCRIRPATQRVMPKQAWVMALLFPLPLFLPLGYHGLICLPYLFVFFPVWIYVGSARIGGTALMRICKFLGAMSYPVFILQDPILRLGEEFQRRHHLSLKGDIVFGLVMYLSVYGIAYAARRLYDQPVRAWLRRRLTLTSTPTTHGPALATGD
ncbi:acyltransferase family protein [Acidisoma silvae]|uniref:Acyltransferase n=1 Tax=Acidisoma silvae TaxID=2802396 RepID=A0A964DZI3_9PROT|nr:acyltransferase [Acidisoma silvae]MCB8876316.1 acyltransferase [Acidisoma silvae]